MRNKSPPIPLLMGLGYAEHGIGRDGGVHRRSAFGQDLRPGLGRQVMAGRDDAAVRRHHRAAVRTVLTGRLHNQRQQ